MGNPIQQLGSRLVDDRILAVNRPAEGKQDEQEDSCATAEPTPKDVFAHAVTIDVEMNRISTTNVGHWKKRDIKQGKLVGYTFFVAK